MRFKFWANSIFWQILLVILFSLPTCFSLLRPGYFPMHDDMQAFRVDQMTVCLRDGQIPCRWVPDMGYGFGYPQFNYYGPLPYYLMSSFHLLGLGLFDSVKLGFILTLLLGNIFIFLFAKELWGNWGGVITALVYAYSPYRASDLFSRGAMGESWAFVFIPLILYAAIRLFKSPKLKNVAFLSLCYSGLVASHNISTLIFSPFLAVFYGLLVLSKTRDKDQIIKSLQPFLVSIIWGIMIAGFFFFPVLAEKNQAHIESMIGGYFDYRIHFVTIKQLFLSTFWGYGSSEIGPHDDLAFFVGPVMLILSTVSLILAFISRRKKPSPSLLFVSFFFISAMVVAFMSHEKSSFVWKLLPFLVYLQFPWRFLVLLNIFLAIAVGYLGQLFITNSQKILVLSTVFILLFIFNISFFTPVKWLNITEQDKFSGASYDKQMTISIFDYLPKTAKFPPNHAAPIYPYLSDQTPISLQKYQHGSDWFDFDYYLVKNNQIIIPTFCFTGWQVKLDSTQINHQCSGDLGLVTVSVPSGQHHLHLELANTFARTFGNMLTLISLPICLFVLLKPSKNE